MQKFNEFLLSLGGLHDATVASISWQPKSKTVEFVLDDLYSNFLGMSEYPGLKTGRILLQGICELSMELSSEDGLKIFEFLPSVDDEDSVTVLFSPSGKITAKFTDAIYPKSKLLSIK